MSGVLVFFMLGSLIGLLYGLILTIFKRGRRRRGLIIAGSSIVALISVSIISEGTVAEQEGFASVEEYRVDRETKRREEAAAKAAARAAEEAKEKAEKEAARAKKLAEEKEKKALGRHCFEATGEHIDFSVKLMRRLRDPDSFEMIETRVAPENEGINIVTMKYRARNGFGGMNVSTAIALMDNESCDIEIVGSE